MHKVFVYGTLKSGFHNHERFLKNYTGVKAKAPGINLHRGPSFPFAVIGKGVAIGELYEVDDSTLKSLDRLEGHPNFYKRILVPVWDECFRRHLAWIYVSPEQAFKHPLVEDGDWKG